MRRAVPTAITAIIVFAFAATHVVAGPQASPQTQPALTAPETRSNQDDFWLSGLAVQGGLVTARGPKGAHSIFLDNEQVKLSPEGFFLLGFDRDAPMQSSLVAILADGRRVERHISVAPGNWRIEYVRANLNGAAKTSAEFQARRGAELARIAAARLVRNESNGWRQKFVRPVPGRISGLFGSQRIYNGTPGSYHSGMDIAAPNGTEFVAPADGVVVLAASDAFTLEGHLLMIDHGMGLNSAFLHSSELLVKEGDFVKQGQVIGRVGATGRASGPHLHWGMKWNDARIDPKLLMPAS
ncbi:MAG: M23 family metallopeptidase [Sphingorhabdus sp.]